jgi:hypothetical protein
VQSAWRDAELLRKDLVARHTVGAEWIDIDGRSPRARLPLHVVDSAAAPATGLLQAVAQELAVTGRQLARRACTDGRRLCSGRCRSRIGLLRPCGGRPASQHLDGRETSQPRESRCVVADLAKQLQTKPSGLERGYRRSTVGDASRSRRSSSRAVSRLARLFGGGMVVPAERMRFSARTVVRRSLEPKKGIRDRGLGGARGKRREKGTEKGSCAGPRAGK